MYKRRFLIPLLTWWRKPRYPELPPTLKQSPLKQMLRFVKELDKLKDDAHAQLGKTYTLDLLGMGPVVVFTGEEEVKQILAGGPKDFANANDPVAFFVGPKSIFLLEDEAHKLARQRAKIAFTSQRLKNYGPIIKDATDAWLDQLEAGQQISAMEAGRDIALDIILKAMFGMEPGPDYNNLRRLVIEFMEGGRATSAGLLSLWLPAEKVRKLVIGRRNPVTMDLEKKQGFLRLLGAIPTIKAARGLMDSLLKQIRKRRETLDDGGQDALAHILRGVQEREQEYTDAEALDEILTLLLAGHDTTAITLSWALYRLSQSPKVVKKMREELDEFFPEQPIDPKRIDELPYLQAVIDEGFRMDAIVAGTARRVRRDMVIGGIQLKKGTIIQAYNRPSMWDKDKWQTPFAFNPEQIQNKKLKPHELAPFGGGHRRCTGAGFAVFESKIILAQTIRRADLKTPEGLVVKRGMLGPMGAPIGPVPVIVHDVRPKVESN